MRREIFDPIKCLLHSPTTCRTPSTPPPLQRQIPVRAAHREAHPTWGAGGTGTHNLEQLKVSECQTSLLTSFHLCTYYPSISSGSWAHGPPSGSNSRFVFTLLERWRVYKEILNMIELSVYYLHFAYLKQVLHQNSNWLHEQNISWIGEDECESDHLLQGRLVATKRYCTTVFPWLHWRAFNMS